MSVEVAMDILGSPALTVHENSNSIWRYGYYVQAFGTVIRGYFDNFWAYQPPYSSLLKNFLYIKC